MQYTLKGITDSEMKSMEELWHVVASLPDKHMSRHIEHLRKIAIMLEIDPDDFYEHTGGHYLYDADEEVLMDQYYER